MRNTRPADRNRRGAERYPVHANVRVLCADSMTGVAARMVNVSDSGAAVESPVPLKLGELWAIPIMLRLALIENLRRVAAQ